MREIFFHLLHQCSRIHFSSLRSLPLIFVYDKDRFPCSAASLRQGLPLFIWRRKRNLKPVLDSFIVELENNSRWSFVAAFNTPPQHHVSYFKLEEVQKSFLSLSGTRRNFRVFPLNTCLQHQIQFSNLFCSCFVSISRRKLSFPCKQRDFCFSQIDTAYRVTRTRRRLVWVETSL